MTTIDLNADLGESYGRWQSGDDEAVLRCVTSASIACGGHAGDPTTMRRTVETAVRHGVTIGAHVSYADLAGFGRRFVDIAREDLADLLLFQISALQGFAQAQGTRVAYVKPHGALYHATLHHETQAAAVIDAVQRADLGLALVTMHNGELARRARKAGVRVVGEAFLDRAYQEDGRLVPRTEPGAVIHDVDAVVARARKLVATSLVTSVSGTEVLVDAESLCLHGDTEGAAPLLARVRAALDDLDVEVRSFA